MKSSNAVGVNKNFSYIMQYTNELADYDLLKFHNLMSLRSHSSPTIKSFPSSPVKLQSLVLPVKSGQRRPNKDKQQYDNRQRQHLSGEDIIMKQEMLNQGKLQERMVVRKREEKYSTPRKNKKQELNVPPTTISRQEKQQQEEDIKGQINRKGLALISSLIIEVLETHYKQKRQFTCGQISAKVLTQFCKKEQQQQKEAVLVEKEAKTVKRRVYDSINVLIALGKIKKEGKWLFMKAMESKVGEEIIEAKKESISNLQKQYNKKKQMLSQMRIQYEKLRSLKLRNQQLHEKQRAIETTLATRAHRESHQQQFKFPLLFAYSQQGKEMQVHIEKQQKPKESDSSKTIIIQSDPLYLLSDLSSLSYVNLNNHGQMNFK